ncbi:hypothetical protein HYU20_02240 [Candidatus Woesearchaeota archaeon]|nr:hypothetical protein [Candidatus Woesearchaeota archaeon]
MDAQDIMEFAGKFSYAFAIIVGIILIVLIWYKVTGHSPEAVDIVLTLQGITIAGLFGFIYKFAKFEGRVESDIKKLQVDWSEMRIQFLEMRKDLSEIKGALNRKKLA